MMIDNPASLQFFMTEDIYMLKQDVDAISNMPLSAVETAEPEFTVTEPITVTEPESIVTEESTIVETVMVAEPEPVVTKPQPSPTVAEKSVVETPKPAFSYLGKNQKNFLIVFHSNGAGRFEDKHFAALTSSLARKELSLDDVAILDLYPYEDTTIADIAAHFKPTRVMILGSRCLLPGWNRLKMNVIAKGNAYSALYTYAFDEMMGDKDKVKAFWEQMKTL